MPLLQNLTILVGTNKVGKEDLFGIVSNSNFSNSLRFRIKRWANKQMQTWYHALLTRAVQIWMQVAS